LNNLILLEKEKMEDLKAARELLDEGEIWDTIWNEDVTFEVWMPILKALKLLENEDYDNVNHVFSEYNNQGKSVGRTLIFLFMDDLEKIKEKNEKLKKDLQTLKEENLRLQEENLHLRYRPEGPGALEAKESFSSLSKGN